MIENVSDNLNPIRKLSSTIEPNPCKMSTN